MAAGVRTLGQQYEFVLYGSVSENNLGGLLHRLRGLCDYATEGGSPFQDREFCLKIGRRGQLLYSWEIFIQKMHLPLSSYKYVNQWISQMHHGL